MSKVKQGELIKTDLGLEVQEINDAFNRLFIGHSTEVYDVLDFLYENFQGVFDHWLNSKVKKVLVVMKETENSNRSAQI